MSKSLPRRNFLTKISLGIASVLALPLIALRPQKKPRKDSPVNALVTNRTSLEVKTVLDALLIEDGVKAITYHRDKRKTFVRVKVVVREKLEARRAMRIKERIWASFNSLSEKLPQPKWTSCSSIHPLPAHRISPPLSREKPTVHP